MTGKDITANDKRCKTLVRLCGDLGTPLLAPVRWPTVIAGHSPDRVIGRRGNRSYLMPASSKPGSHFSRIFADPRRFGRKVGAANQNLHSI